MHRAKCLILISIWLSVGIVSAAEKGAVSLGTDKRLAHRVTISSDTVRLAEVVKLLNSVAKADIYVQAELLRRPVAIAVNHKSVADVMENLAVLFGASWIRRDDAYILVTDEVKLQMVSAPKIQVDTQQVKQAFFRSLTPVQIARLRANVRIPFNRFSPAQRRWALILARERFLAQPQMYPSSILRGKGLELAAAVIGRVNRQGLSVPTGLIELSLVSDIITDSGTLTQDGPIADRPRVRIR